MLRDSPDPVTPDRYREAYDEILSRTRSELPDCGVLLIDPFYISTDRSSNSFRASVLKLLPEYLDIVKEMAGKYEARHLKTHTMFLNLLLHHEPDLFCPEPVHPNATGHLAIAEAVYEALR